MVGLAGVAPADRQKVEHAVRDRCGRAEARKHFAQLSAYEIDFHVGFGPKVRNGCG